MVDILIKNGLIYTLNSSKRVFKKGAIAIYGDKIVDIGPTSELEKKYSAEKVIDASRKAVLPGFVNIHTHLPSIFVRGVYGVVREGLYQVLFPIKEYLEPEHC
jgi:cytosine/adenosine deaminase-related metal-dependent hydrolase